MLSWDQVDKMIDEVPYDIDFYRMSSIPVSGDDTLEAVSASDIIDMILSPPAMPALPEREEPPVFDWSNIDKQARKEMEKEEEMEEWVKEHNKIPAKQASKNLKRVLKELGVYD